MKNLSTTDINVTTGIRATFSYLFYEVLPTVPIKHLPILAGFVPKNECHLDIQVFQRSGVTDPNNQISEIRYYVGIFCATCNASYVGETQRHIKAKIDKHFYTGKSYIFSSTLPLVSPSNIKVALKLFILFPLPFDSM